VVPTTVPTNGPRTNGVRPLCPDATRATTVSSATDESRLKDELDESESYVKVGDPAMQVVGDEFDDKDQ